MPLIAPPGLLSAVLAASVSAPSAGGVDAGLNTSSLAWSDAWGRVEAIDYGLTAGFAVALVLGQVAISPPPMRFRGGVLFDDGIRSAFKIGDEAGRLRASSASDVLQDILVAYPLVDAGLVALLVHGNADTAWQMAMIDAESLLLAGALMTITKNVTGRARPYVDSCGNDTCGSRDRNRSFFSGHTTAAFTGAGLVCAHHANLPLYGNATADQASCAGALALAAVTGYLRIASDQHYATDVVAGALIGLLSGYLLPELLFYRASDGSQPRAAEPSTMRVSVVPELGPDRAALRVSIAY